MTRVEAVGKAIGDLLRENAALVRAPIVDSIQITVKMHPNGGLPRMRHLQVGGQEEIEKP